MQTPTSEKGSILSGEVTQMSKAAGMPLVKFWTRTFISLMLNGGIGFSHSRLNFNTQVTLHDSAKKYIYVRLGNIVVSMHLNL